MTPEIDAYLFEFATRTGKTEKLERVEAALEKTPLQLFCSSAGFKGRALEPSAEKTNPQPKENQMPCTLTATTPVRPSTKYSREKRDNLRLKLGGKCARCSASEHLQFDCIVTRGKAHHEMSFRQRLNFYEQEAARGNLQLLCPLCHVEKTLTDIARRRFLDIQFHCPKCHHLHSVSEMTRAAAQALSCPKPLPVQLTPPEAPYAPNQPLPAYEAVLCAKCNRTTDDHDWTPRGVFCRLI